MVIVGNLNFAENFGVESLFGIPGAVEPLVIVRIYAFDIAVQTLSNLTNSAQSNLLEALDCNVGPQILTKLRFV